MTEVTEVSEMSEVPPHIRAAARAAPGQWIGLVDPTWAGEGPPPAWAVIGRWRADEGGGVEEFAANEEYRESPLALDWPAPSDPVDAAVQSCATGYGPPEAVYRALASAQIAVPLDGGDGVGGIDLPDGETVAVVFTARSWLTAAGGPDHALLGAADLLEWLPPGCRLVLNPGAPVVMRLEPALLREALDARPGGPGLPLRPFDRAGR
ncbi:type VII secretion system-associated protein [Kitasatospora herbaricolor]|uniref:Type VII secretion system-associated protein n=1 Tax=Kitasatospora herbaricolor TaxID=68217 RepID=A0ABZ1W0T6_9ACTN|nr:type VII secretion system-associated protein [Kitasatospora herbaricolor]